MTATTTNAIRKSFENTIKGLVPIGSTFGRHRYQLASPSSDWDNRAKSDIDREFTVEAIKRGDVLVFGRTDEYDYEGTVEIVIGHSFGSKRSAAVDRRDTDLHQIYEELEKTSNFPASVQVIRLNGYDIGIYDKFWISRIEFRMTYSLAAP